MQVQIKDLEKLLRGFMLSRYVTDDVTAYISSDGDYCPPVETLNCPAPGSTRLCLMMLRITDSYLDCSTGQSKTVPVSSNLMRRGWRGDIPINILYMTYIAYACLQQRQHFYLLDTHGDPADSYPSLLWGDIESMLMQVPPYTLLHRHDQPYPGQMFRVLSSPKTQTYSSQDVKLADPSNFNFLHNYFTDELKSKERQTILYGLGIVKKKGSDMPAYHNRIKLFTLYQQLFLSKIGDLDVLLLQYLRGMLNLYKPEERNPMVAKFLRLLNTSLDTAKIKDTLDESEIKFFEHMKSVLPFLV